MPFSTISQSTVSNNGLTSEAFESFITIITFTTAANPDK